MLGQHRGRLVVDAGDNLHILKKYNFGNDYTEQDEKIYQEVVVDDVYKIKQLRPRYIIDIGAHKGFVYQAASASRPKTPLVYFGFDKNIDLTRLAAYVTDHIYSVAENITTGNMHQIAAADIIIAGLKHFNKIKDNQEYKALLKIDIQGAEKELLSEDGLFSVHHGVNKISSIDAIAFEWHHSALELNKVLTLLEDNKYMINGVSRAVDTMSHEDTYIVIAERE